MEWLWEEKREGVGPVGAVRMTASDRSETGEGRGNVEGAEGRGRVRGVVVDGRSVEEARERIRTGMNMILELRLKRGQMSSTRSLHDRDGGGGGGGGYASDASLGTSLYTPSSSSSSFKGSSISIQLQRRREDKSRPFLRPRRHRRQDTRTPSLTRHIDRDLMNQI